MIYVDTSVLLARLFAEDASPATTLWSGGSLVSSRLLEFETFNRVNARGAAQRDLDAARHLLDRVGLIELSGKVLARALAPFPSPVRTLDSLHLATMTFLRGRGQAVELATYDHRLATAAAALGFPRVSV